MPVFTKHLILPACALSVLLVLPTAVHAKDYASCLSDKLKGISNDAAVKAITDACKAEYPQKNTVPLRVAAMTPLSEVQSITKEQYYENQFHTMYKTTDRVHQEVAARTIIEINPNAITEDFRFIEAMLLNGVGYSKIYHYVDRLRHNNAPLNNLVGSMYHTYSGQMTPDIEVKAFNALIYTLYRNDKRYSENSGNNAEMAGLQAKHLHIYQNDTKEAREAMFNTLKKQFDALPAREQHNVQIVAKALFRNIDAQQTLSFKNRNINKVQSLIATENLIYAAFLTNFDKKTLINN